MDEDSAEASVIEVPEMSDLGLFAVVLILLEYQFEEIREIKINYCQFIPPAKIQTAGLLQIQPR